MFATILSGAFAAALIAPTVWGLIAAASGAADIAFDFTGRSQKHADIARRYLAVVAKMAGGESPDILRNEWLSISADEPETYRLVQIIAYNHAIESLGRNTPPEALTFLQRLRAHFLRT